jgi:protein MpaA
VGVRRALHIRPVRRIAALPVLALTLAGSVAAQAAPVPHERETIGRSVLGRPLVVHVVGERTAPHRVLVVGCVHGNERAGEAVTRRLRGARPPAGVALWLLDEANPDGCRAGTRGNAHDVDLNRNAPWRWQPIGAPGDTYYAGPHATSEPESRALDRLVRRIRPAVTIWYHQHAALVDTSGGDVRIERRYANRVGLPLRDFHSGLTGIWTGWQNATFHRATAFVVELPGGPLDRAALARHAAAVLDAARDVVSDAGAAVAGRARTVERAWSRRAARAARRRR